MTDLKHLTGVFVELSLPAFRQPVGTCSNELSYKRFSAFILLAAGSTLDVSVVLYFCAWADRPRGDRRTIGRWRFVTGLVTNKNRRRPICNVTW